MPDNGFVRDVCRNAGGALALTSANLSGQPSSLTVEDLEPLWPSCAAVFDGALSSQLASSSLLIMSANFSGRRLLCQ